MNLDEAKQKVESTTLPANIQAQLLRNLADCPNGYLTFASTLSNIIGSFWWIVSPEGEDYWREIDGRAKNGEFDPPVENEENELVKTESVDDLAKRLLSDIHEREYNRNPEWFLSIDGRFSRNNKIIEEIFRQLAKLIHENRDLKSRIVELEKLL